MVINSCAMTGVHAKRKKGVRWEMGLTRRPKSEWSVRALALTFGTMVKLRISFTSDNCYFLLAAIADFWFRANGSDSVSSKPPAKAR